MRKYLSEPVVLKVFTKSPIGLLLNPSPFLNVCDITIGSPVGNVLATLPCCRHRDARLCKVRAQTAEIGPLKISVPSRFQIVFSYQALNFWTWIGPKTSRSPISPCAPCVFLWKWFDKSKSFVNFPISNHSRVQILTTQVCKDQQHLHSHCRHMLDCYQHATVCLTSCPRLPSH